MSWRGVPVVFGEFDGTPEQFTTSEGGRLRLEDLEDDRRGYLVLIFTDGKSLAQPREGFVWENLARWPQVAWMELREPRSWDESAALPVHYGIPIFPANPSGLLQAVGRFLVEQSAGEDFSQTAAEGRGALPPKMTPSHAYIETYLGDALPWAQDCAMMPKPYSLGMGLADALRRRFYPVLLPERIERLLMLPGTMYNSAGLRFSDEVLKTLRHGFLQRRNEHEQREILEFLQEKIQEAEPEEKGSPKHLAWEAMQERIRLELEPDADLRRLAELAKTPLGPAISAGVEGHGFQNEPDMIPLRNRPRNKNALQRLARIAANLDIPKLEAYPVSPGHWVALLVLSFSFVSCLLKSLTVYKDTRGGMVMKFVNPDSALVGAQLEVRQKNNWQITISGNVKSLHDRPLHGGQAYRLTLYGNGFRSQRDFVAPRDSSIVVSVEPKSRARPCQESHPNLGLTIQCCPANATAPVAFNSWQEGLGPRAPNGRWMSIGLEIDSTHGTIEPALTSIRDLLLQTGSVDIVYRLRPDSTGNWRFAEVWQRIQDDLGPVLRQSQLLWWTAGSVAQPIALADSFNSFQRALCLSEANNSWMARLAKLLEPADSVVVLEHEIIGSLGLAAASGNGAPIALIRPPIVKPPTAPSIPELTQKAQPQPGQLNGIIVANADSLVPTLTFASNDTSFMQRIAVSRALTFDNLSKLPLGEVAIGARGYRFGEQLRPGRWTVTAQATGYQSIGKTFDVVAGQTQEIVLKLEIHDIPPPTPPPGMAYVQAGRFLMGSTNGASDEKPEHEVYVDAFFMDNTEVTVAQYQAFVQARQYREPGTWPKQLQHPNFPVINVSWDDASAYAQWKGKKLPSEAQWEYAARGGHTGLDGKPKYEYPWGNEIDTSKAKYYEASSSSDWEKELRAVGSYQPNAFGLYDLAGNVWEWCQDWYDENYYTNSPSSNPAGPATGTQRVLRGGAWDDDPTGLRCADRSGDGPAVRYHNVGFRCVQDVR
ncbi:MAG: SUMF1/EgtB/PvdO family nonheme iron enzyme [bacterium]